MTSLPFILGRQEKGLLNSHRVATLKGIQKVQSFERFFTSQDVEIGTVRCPFLTRELALNMGDAQDSFHAGLSAPKLGEASRNPHVRHLALMLAVGALGDSQLLVTSVHLCGCIEATQT